MTTQKAQPPVPEISDKERQPVTAVRRLGSLLGDRSQAASGQTAAGQEPGNWDAYRRWLSRVNLPDKRRIAMDPSLYTWKGYRNWSDKVRRNWNPEE